MASDRNANNKIISIQGDNRQRRKELSMEFDTPEYWAHEYREQQERQQQQAMEEHYNFCGQVVQDFIDGKLTREEAEGYFASRDEDPADLDEWVANTTASAERNSTMRYTYLGDKLTGEQLTNLQCDPVRRADGKCIISTRMATALVVDGNGKRQVVKRRRLRLNRKE